MSHWLELSFKPPQGKGKYNFLTGHMAASFRKEDLHGKNHQAKIAIKKKTKTTSNKITNLCQCVEEQASLEYWSFSPTQQACPKA